MLFIIETDLKNKFLSVKVSLVYGKFCYLYFKKKMLKSISAAVLELSWHGVVHKSRNRF